MEEGCVDVDVSGRLLFFERGLVVVMIVRMVVIVIMMVTMFMTMMIMAM